MKLLFNSAASNGSFQFFVPNGQYGGFVVIYNVTNAAGVTMDRTNFGTITTQWAGKDVLSSIDVDFLNRIDNVYGGVSAFSSAIGAAAYCFTYIPVSAWFDAVNVLDVAPGDSFSVKCQFSDLADVAICAGGSVSVYGIPKVGVMNYLHKMSIRNVTLGGAGSQADTFPINNVGEVYLKDAVTNLVTRYILQKDGTTMVDASAADLVALSDWIHTLETTNSIIAIELAQSKNIEEVVGKMISYEVTVSGATVVPQYFSFYEFTPGKVESSFATSQRILNGRLN